MVSLVICRELSFHFDFDNNELDQVPKAVNSKRKNEKYTNSKAAITVCNTDIKMNLLHCYFIGTLTMENQR